MELRQMHSYAITQVGADRKPNLLMEQKKNQNFTTMISHNPKGVIIAGHGSGAIYVWRKSKSFANLANEKGTNGKEQPEYILPSTTHDRLKDPKIAHKGPVTVLKIQPNTSFLYSGSADRTIKLWDIFHSEHVPTCVQTFSGHGGSITDIEFGAVGPTPGFMFSGSTDRTVIIWRNAEGREMMLYPFYVKLRVIELKSWPNSLVFCPVGRMGQGDLYIGDSDAFVRHLHIDTESKGYKEKDPKVFHSSTSGHQLGIISLRAEVHEGLIFSISNDTTIKVWEQATGVAKKSMKNENRVRFNGMHIDSANQEVMMVDDIGALHVWNWISERLVFSEQLANKSTDRTDRLHAVACNKDGSEVYMLKNDRVDSYYVIRGLTHVALKGHEASLIGLGYLGSAQADIFSGEEVLYSAALDNTVRSWDPLSMQCSDVLRESTNTEMSAFAVFKKHRSILTGNDDGSLRMWGIESGQHVLQKGHSNTISAICVAWTGKTLDDPAGRDLVFTCSFDGEVLTWEISGPTKKADGTVDETRRISPVGRTKAHKAEILCCSYFPPGLKADKYPNGLLVTAGNDMQIRKWTVSDRQELDFAGNLQCTGPDGYTPSTLCHKDSIACMAVDANFLFTGADDATIKIWDMSGNFLVRVLDESFAGHHDAIRKLLILPNEGYLVSLGIDNSIKIWDYTKPQVLWEKKHEHGEITSWCYDEKKRVLVCGTEEKTIVTVDIPDNVQLELRRQETMNAVVTEINPEQQLDEENQTPQQLPTS